MPFFEPADKAPVDRQAIFVSPPANTYGARGPTRPSAPVPSTSPKQTAPVRSGCRAERSPGDPRQLVGQGDNRNVPVRSRQETPQPCPQRRLRLREPGQCCPRTMDKHHAQVRVATLRDPEELRFAPGRVLPEHKPEPGREVPCSTEDRRIAHGCYQCAAFRTPTPGIDTKRRAASSARARSMNSRFSPAMRWLSAAHSSRSPRRA
jgi:hypothetical protein